MVTRGLRGFGSNDGLPTMTISGRFNYRAADAEGRQRAGSVDGDDESSAVAALALQGLRVFEITPSAGQAPSIADEKPAFPIFGSGSKITALQRVWLFDELATLLESGVVLAEAVDGLQQGEGATALGRALGKVNATLRAGTPLSVALANAELELPRYVTELVRAGESTGRLAGAARAAAQQQLADYEFGREVRNALVYPAVLLGSGVMAMLVVFVFVVPKFATILDNPKADLPIVSLWVLHGGVWLASHLEWVAAAVAALVGAALWASRNGRARQWAWDLAATLPWLRDWVTDAESYRWSAMLALLTQNRVNLLEALAQANSTLRGRAMAFKGQRVADAVRQGRSLAAAVSEQGMLSSAANSLVRVGERSGTLDRALSTLAGRYRSASQQRIKRFLVLLEPVTILLISLVLGGIMISVILAVTSLTNVIG